MPSIYETGNMVPMPVWGVSETNTQLNVNLFEDARLFKKEPQPQPAKVNVKPLDSNNKCWENRRKLAKNDYIDKKIVRAALYAVTGLTVVAALCILSVLPVVVIVASASTTLLVVGILGLSAIGALAAFGTAEMMDVIPYHKKAHAQKVVQNINTYNLDMVSNKRPLGRRKCDIIHIRNLHKYGFINREARDCLMNLRKEYRIVKQQHDKESRQFIKVGLGIEQINAATKLSKDKLVQLEGVWNVLRADIVRDLPNPMASPAA